MADTISGLFGTQNPQQLQQDYLSGLMVSPSQMGQQGLLQQLASVGANAGAMMGYGGGRLLGGKVSGEVEAGLVNNALEQVNKMGITDPAQKMAKIGEILSANPATAKQGMIAQQEAVKLKEQGYKMKGFENADKARKAVADLLATNPNATSQELYAAAAPFSSDPEAIIKTVVRREEQVAAVAAKQEAAAAATVAKQEAAAEKAQSRIEEIRLRGQQAAEAARLAGASREEVARIAAEGRAATSAMMGQMRLDIARMNNTTRREIEASKRNTGVLAPSLQKAEGSDLETIDNYEAMSAVLDAPVQALTPNDKGVVALRLNPAARASYAAANFLGRSTPESRSYADLQASVAQAVNIKTDAARGVQTDKDVVRFANALIEANARNDTTATREALIKFQNAAKKAAEATKVRVNSRRQAQNVGVYFTDVATPEGTSPSGANQNRTPPMYATNGTQRIVSTDGGKTWKEVR
tara:strand:+ start:662 stop:2068 length:1407 start_codon:yes stop_codon:yes gene_type:complete